MPTAKNAITGVASSSFSGVGCRIVLGPFAGFLTLTDATLSSLNAADGSDDESHPLEDGTRLAVAPAVGGIVLSDFWHETSEEYSPYGDYVVHLVRAE